MDLTNPDEVRCHKRVVKAKIREFDGDGIDFTDHDRVRSRLAAISHKQIGEIAKASRAAAYLLVFDLPLLLQDLKELRDRRRQ